MLSPAVAVDTAAIPACATLARALEAPAIVDPSCCWSSASPPSSETMPFSCENLVFADSADARARLARSSWDWYQSALRRAVFLRKRSEEHTSELQSLMRNSNALFSF